MHTLSETERRHLYANPAGASRQARDKLAAARVWLMKHKPFFGVLARAFRLEASLDVPGYRLLPADRLRFNPIVVLETRFASVCARLAHVALHAALGAFARRRERCPRRWNVACDLAIAPLLEAADLGFGCAPETILGGARSTLPRGTSAEQYYSLLEEGVSPDPLWCDLCDEQETLAAPTGQFSRQDGTEGEDAMVAREPNPRGDDGTSAASEPSLLDAGASELQWKLRLAAAYEEEVAAGGRSFGEVPGWLDELVRATLEPPSDWSAVLQQSIHLLQRTDRSYLRPSRRMSALADAEGHWPEVVSMPGRRIESGGSLVAVVDTSASLAADTLSRFFGAIVAAATAEGIDELRLLQADATVTRDESVFAAELLFRPVDVVGRGGTDFGPALSLLAEEGRRLGQRFTVAYLTDLDGRFPEATAMRCLDVLWVVPTKTAVVPPFGRVLEMRSR